MQRYAKSVALHRADWVMLSDDWVMVRANVFRIADGSEIRSLSGRSARLGDGTSRNPKNRDALLEQRTKDLQGIIGQVRGFDLDEFFHIEVRRRACSDVRCITLGYEAGTTGVVTAGIVRCLALVFVIIAIFFFIFLLMPVFLAVLGQEGSVPVAPGEAFAS